MKLSFWGFAFLLAIDIFAQEKGANTAEHDGAIQAAFPTDGVTLTITSRCARSDPLCGFEAKIDAPPELFQSIEGVDYTYVPDRRTSPAPVTDASTHFHFKGRQTRGEDVYAKVRIKGKGDAAPKTILVTGYIPFASEVEPKLPAGLRFEDKYSQQFLEGGIPTKYYYFRIYLRGDAAALARIRSLEYRLPAAHFSKTRVPGRADSEYLLEDTAVADPKWDILAVIRWRDGTTSTHTLPFRPR